MGECGECEGEFAARSPRVEVVGGLPIPEQVTSVTDGLAASRSTSIWYSEVCSRVPKLCCKSASLNKEMCMKDK